MALKLKNILPGLFGQTLDLGGGVTVDDTTGNIAGVGTLSSGTITSAGAISSTVSITSTGGGGVGYAIGGGGAVTQITSRTTGVTLNKATGSITLVSAAGSAVATTFTVTDSVIAATDTIVVHQQSGTDLYEIFVTNTVAGAFKITSFTTGGTTTEQPVFNFAVLKAVAS